MKAARVSVPALVTWGLLALALPAPGLSLSVEQHEALRAQLVQREREGELGGTLELSPAETVANALLMEFKYQEMDLGFQNLSLYGPAGHFFHMKTLIEESEVFKFIRKMPKGAALHVHDTALIGGDYVLLNITYRDNLYYCASTGKGQIHLRFANSTPPAPEDGCDFRLLKDVRKEQQNVQKFDAELARHFTLETPNPREEYSDINEVWSKFGNIFQVITPMLTYKPVWEDYFYEALRQYREDNIFYLEFRSTLPMLYDLEGNIFNSVQCAEVYKQVNDKFKKDYPDFFGSRLIYAPSRNVLPEDVREYIEITWEIKSRLGDFIAGFDLVGQEDTGKPLKEFIAELTYVPLLYINVFYHAGETNWFGTSTDYNLIDAVLLGAKRLGHAYALLKHPEVAKIVKAEQIAIEVNPISNQVLMLVEDMRNHPASVMLAENYPVVISSDDPGLWGALPMSHDLYQAFVGMASRHSDLRLLKQLVINTITFSSMPLDEKNEAFERFYADWNKFILNIGHFQLQVNAL